MKEKETIKGYKVTDAKMQCQGFQYEFDKIFEHKGDLILCPTQNDVKKGG